jgi:poly(A) polymerase
MLRHVAFVAGSDAAAAALVLLNASADQAGRSGVQRLIAELVRTPAFRPTGKDVIALGVPPGPSIGQMLEAARHRWIEAGCPSGLQEQMVLLGAAAGALRHARA